MIVFAGPSLGGEDLSAFDAVTVRPPAKQGDLYLATLEHPRAIGIVDGYFEGVPSVWHKEVLWALTRGITVLGAASMGALRAAELDTYGMIGVGAVYRSYRDGDIEDDDEVALLHGPEEIGYLGLSEAMVNVRATCAAAGQAGVLSHEQCSGIVAAAKEIFYKNRTWEAILDTAHAGLLSREERQSVAGWIASNAVDQKKLDALALLARMQDGDFTGSSEGDVRDFRFENTSLWQSSVKSWRQAAGPEDTPAALADEMGYRLVSDEHLYWRSEDDDGKP